MFEREKRVLKGRYFGVRSLFMAGVAAISTISVQAADVSPLYFNEFGTETAIVDHDQNQEFWDALMKYKIWGTTGVALNKGNFEIRETSGFTGTAKGGNIKFENGDHQLGGPVLSGGDLSFVNGADKDTIFKGPIRALGNLELPTWYSVTAPVYGGHACIQGDMRFPGGNNQTHLNWLANVHKDGGFVFSNGQTLLVSVNNGDITTQVQSTSWGDYSYEDCPETVPPVDTALSVPHWDVPANVQWIPAINMTQGYTETAYLDVPPISGTDTSKIIDLYLEGINIASYPNKYLYIRMPSDKKRLVRIYVRDSVNIDRSANRAVIQVVYVNPGATWDAQSQSWQNFESETSYYVPNEEYAGDVLFYTPHDIKWRAMKKPSYQGTFMTTKTFEIADHFVLAGQLIANKISFESDITGDFHYVPFDPPVIMPSVLQNAKYEEDDILKILDFELSKAPLTEVSFDFCIDFFDSTYMDSPYWSIYEYVFESLGGVASAEDLNLGTNGENNFIPLCDRDEFRHVSILPGKTKPNIADAAFINVAKDSLSEGNELLSIHIKNLYGAVVEGGNLSAGIPVVILDQNNTRPTFDNNQAVLQVAENDSTGPIAGSILVHDAESNDLTFEITGGTGAEIFEIESPITGYTDDAYVKVYLKQGVSLDYEELLEEGFEYTIRVTMSDVGGSVSREFTVNVLNVNEAPTIEKQTLAVSENQVSDKPFAVVKASDLDNGYDPKNPFEVVFASDPNFFNKYLNNEFILVRGDTALFKINAETGEISLKKGVKLDYETKSSYEVVVRVQDVNDTTLFAEASITLTVTDEDDEPKITPKDSTVKIPDPTDSTKTVYVPNILSNGLKVDENNPADKIVGAVIVTGQDPSRTLIYEITKDTSGLFAIDPATGIVTIPQENVLDYERDSIYVITVKASDGPEGEVGTQFDEQNITIRVNDLNEAPIVAEQSFKVEEGPVGQTVGTVVSTDNDTAPTYSKHNYEIVGGDEDFFRINTATGEISTKTVIDYDERVAAGDTVFTLDIRVKDAMPGPNGEVLDAVQTMTIVLTNVNELPTIITDEVAVPENSLAGVVVDTLKATDPDNDSLTYALAEPSDLFDVTEMGEIIVKPGAILDFETTEKVTIQVKVSDPNGGEDTRAIIVKITDENEAPTIADQDTKPIPEDAAKGTVVDTIKASDPDIKTPAFGTITYELVEPSEKFEIDSKTGVIKLLDALDFESEEEHKLVVRVSDGTFADTATVTIPVRNVSERSEVEIVKAENQDSTWKPVPDTLYTNKKDLLLEWRADDNTFSSDTTLTDGTHVIIKSYKDPGKDLAGSDTIVVVVSTQTPIVTVSKEKTPEIETNIFTIEEENKDSSTIFVNTEKNEIYVTVEDPATSKKESFTITVSLDTLNVPTTVISKDLAEIAKNNFPLKTDSKNETHTPINGEKIAVSYTDKIAGKEVIVTYYTDMDGEILEGESGKEEMTVTYTTVIGGKNVEISFVADVLTGNVIKGENGEMYSVAYETKDSKGNTMQITYSLTEKGTIARNEHDDATYQVTYNYQNKFGNTASQSITIVLDKKPPLVWIKTPTKDEVIRSNMAEVIWYVSPTGDSADFVLQDTLNIQSLERGANTIVRFFVDKAGNMVSDTVYVVMKDAKDLEIAVEQPVTIIPENKVAEYYAKNPPKEGQTYAISIKNPTTEEEREIFIGGDFKQQEGSGEAPYPGLKNHLGPTLGIDVKVPVYSSIGGLATLDDLLAKDGQVALEGVDAKSGKKMNVDDYVKNYCSADFASKLTSDYSQAAMYDTKLRVKIWIFTSLGTFVDYYSFTYDLNDPSAVDQAGLLQLYFELKPDKDGNVRTTNGKLLATGAYVYKTELNVVTEAKCTLPPVDNADGVKKGSRKKTVEDMLKPFGYKRPNTK